MFWSITLLCASGALFTWGLGSMFTNLHMRIDETNERLDKLEKNN